MWAVSSLQIIDVQTEIQSAIIRDMKIENARADYFL